VPLIKLGLEKSVLTLTTTTTIFFGLNASKLVNTDTVRPEGGEKTLQSSRLPPPNLMLSNTQSEHAHYSPAQTSTGKSKEQNIAFNLFTFVESKRFVEAKSLGPNKLLIFSPFSF